MNESTNNTTSKWNGRTSDWMNWGIRGANAAGSAGFGWLIGPLLFGWNPTWSPTVLSVLGAIVVAALLDLTLVAWHNRKKMSESSHEQLDIAESMANLNLGATTLASGVFVLIRLVPFVWADPSGVVVQNVFRARLVLVVGFVAVLMFQFVQNQRWYNNAPSTMRQQARATATAASQKALMDVENNAMAAIAPKVKAKVDGLLDKYANQKANEMVGDMMKRLGATNLVPVDWEAAVESIEPAPGEPSPNGSGPH